MSSTAFAGPDDKPLKKFDRRGRAFGTDTALIVLHSDPDAAREGLNNAMAGIQRVDSLFTLYRDDSPIVKLNRDGVLESPDPMFVELMKIALERSVLTDGTFDITVQPLWLLYAKNREAGKLPTPDEISAARALVDYRNVEVSENQIRFKKPGMAVTLNGIAQGYATDRALAELKKQGIQHALVNAGEFGAVGRNAEGEAWTVGIQNPRQDDATIATVSLSDRCLATSGDYSTTFTSDRKNHHIFDPKTGVSPAGLSSVSIVAPHCVDADGTSTAVMVMGAEKGMKYVTSRPELEALFVHKDGTSVQTKGFPLTK